MYLDIDEVEALVTIKKEMSIELAPGLLVKEDAASIRRYSNVIAMERGLVILAAACIC